MPDVLIGLSDKQMAALRAAALIAGMTLEQYAAQAVSLAVDARYVLPKTAGQVVPFKGLKSAVRGTES